MKSKPLPKIAYVGMLVKAVMDEEPDFVHIAKVRELKDHRYPDPVFTLSLNYNTPWGAAHDAPCWLCWDDSIVFPDCVSPSKLRPMHIDSKERLETAIHTLRAFDGPLDREDSKRRYNAYRPRAENLV